MSNFLVVLGCSNDDSVSLSSPIVLVMSVSVSPASVSVSPQTPLHQTVQLHKIHDIHVVVRLL